MKKQDLLNYGEKLARDSYHKQIEAILCYGGFAEAVELLWPAIEAIKMQHTEWGRNDGNCNAECTDVCKALKDLDKALDGGE